MCTEERFYTMKISKNVFICVYMCVYTYIHTYTHAYIVRCMFIRNLSCPLKIYTYTYTCMHACMQIITHHKDHTYMRIYYA